MIAYVTQTDPTIQRLLHLSREGGSEAEVQDAVRGVGTLINRFLAVCRLRGKHFNDERVKAAMTKFISLCQESIADQKKKYILQDPIESALRQMAVALLNIEGLEGGGTRLLFEARTEEGLPMPADAPMMSPRAPPTREESAPASSPLSNSGSHPTGPSAAATAAAAVAAAAAATATPGKKTKQRRRLAFADPDEVAAAEPPQPTPPPSDPPPVAPQPSPRFPASPETAPAVGLSPRGVPSPRVAGSTGSPRSSAPPSPPSSSSTTPSTSSTAPAPAAATQTTDALPPSSATTAPPASTSASTPSPTQDAAATSATAPAAGDVQAQPATSTSSTSNSSTAAAAVSTSSSSESPSPAPSSVTQPTVSSEASAPSTSTTEASSSSPSPSIILPSPRAAHLSSAAQSFITRTESPLPRAVLSIPAVDSAAPPFKAKAARDVDELEVSLQSLAGKWIVLLFYAKDFNPRTAQELSAFSVRAAAFTAVNATLVAASTDSIDNHLAWLASEGLRAPGLLLISDKDHTVAEAYGVYDSVSGTAHSATVIISPAGRIHYFALYSAEALRSPSEALRLLGSTEA